MGDQGDFVKLREAAKSLGMKYSWLRKEANARRIPCIRTGGDVGTFKVNIEQVKAAILARTAANQGGE